MGDRGNIVIRDDQWGTRGPHEAVFLYGHWSGYDLPGVVHRALSKHWRWDDGPYLARIVFDVMTEGDHGEETGFGISTGMPDNEHPLLVLRTKDRRLYKLSPDAYGERGFAALDESPSISFAEYVAAPERTWDNLTDTSVPA